MSLNKKMLNEIKSLVSLMLSEDKYKEMTGEKYVGKDLEKFLDKNIIAKNPQDAFEKRIFVHFTDTPKIGINPKSIYLHGYYFYPYTQKILDGFVLNIDSRHRGQGRGARYVYLIEVDKTANILESDEIYGSISDKLQNIIRPIKEKVFNTSKLKEIPGYVHIDAIIPGKKLEEQAKDLARKIYDVCVEAQKIFDVKKAKGESK